ncbi:MAG: HutD family protein [Actinomycetota bacterium]|nr:HutD family protein [Actinomycetota bacterium]
MPLQKFAEHFQAPWPNGRGTSYEIASQTPGVTGWTWRVAIAPVIEDCDFSHFENVHRQLLIISGGEMILNVGGETVVCRPGEVAVFAGDIPTTAKLVNGPIVDLNLMTVRGKSSGVMTHITKSGLLEPCEMLVAVSQTAEITVDGKSALMHHQDAYLDASNCKIQLTHGTLAHITLNKSL